MKRHPCGCTSPRDSLDPRHIIHYDSTTPDDPVDERAAEAAFLQLEKARSVHIAGVGARSPGAIESSRRLYKEAALAFARAGDATGAVLADDYDSLLDDDIDRIRTWSVEDLDRYLEKE